MHLTAQRLDLLADRGDDAPQQVGAHMGLLLPGDLRRAPCCKNTSVTKPHSSSPMRVVSLPSEKVPRRPRQTGCSRFVQLAGGEKCSTALTRSSSAGPRSSTMGGSPAGPAAALQTGPQAPGRTPPGGGQRLVPFCTGKIHLLCRGRSGEPRRSAFLASSFSVTATVYTSLGWPWRASTESFATPRCCTFARGTRAVQGFFKCLRLPGGERQADVCEQNHIIVCSLFQLLSMRHCST